MAYELGGESEHFRGREGMNRRDRVNFGWALHEDDDSEAKPLYETARRIDSPGWSAGPELSCDSAILLTLTYVSSPVAGR